MTTTTRNPAPRASSRPAFTLVELLVSIALVLVLILGVNTVFKLTSDTVGATNSLSDAIRMNRSVQQSMFDDLKHVVLPGTGLSRGGPFFIIRSERMAAFQDAKDEQTSRSYSPSANVAAAALGGVDATILSRDLNGDNDENDAGEAGSMVDMSDRNHRVDVMMFFARDVYRRQTGNDGTYAADMTANEAMVWYGHLRQPNATQQLAGSKLPGYQRSGSPTESGTAQNNPFNFYARQWILGRYAMLLAEPVADPPTSNNWVIPRYDAWGNKQENQSYIGRSRDNANPALNQTKTALSPLSEGSSSTINGGSLGSPEIQFSRYDLAGTSIEGYRENILKTAINARTSANEPWYGSLSFRYAGFPFPNKPLDSLGAARTVPCFVPACTQFAVEFAGDFISQVHGDVTGDGVVDSDDLRRPEYGQAIAAKPDGIVDFIIDRSPGAAPVQRVRWYGFPRNVDTFDDAADHPVIRGIPVSGDINTMRDVVPLRDLRRACPPLPPTEQPPGEFEHFVLRRGGGQSAATQEEQWDAQSGPGVTDYGVNNAIPFDAVYTAAWQPPGTYPSAVSATAPRPPDPNVPKMIRIVAGVDDPDGRMSSTQYYEYVVELP